MPGRDDMKWLVTLLRRLWCDHLGKMVVAKRTGYTLEIKCQHCGANNCVDVDQWSNDWRRYHSPQEAE
jgi:hypothetical protein